ncbi:hypothetical protein [Streptomyces sp. NPDC030920]|uniref:hypothetical protein n=1 Tax=Streptomyces sp. NPDC030920 TaxID=3365308 RepID=UPI00384C39E3
MTEILSYIGFVDVAAKLYEERGDQEPCQLPELFYTTEDAEFREAKGDRPETSEAKAGPVAGLVQNPVLNHGRLLRSDLVHP